MPFLPRGRTRSLPRSQPPTGSLFSVVCGAIAAPDPAGVSGWSARSHHRPDGPPAGRGEGPSRRPAGSRSALLSNSHPGGSTGRGGHLGVVETARRQRASGPWYMVHEPPGRPAATACPTRPHPRLSRWFDHPLPAPYRTRCRHRHARRDRPHHGHASSRTCRHRLSRERHRPRAWRSPRCRRHRQHRRHQLRIVAPR